MSAALRPIRRMPMLRITITALVLFVVPSQCSTANDSPFSLTNRATGFCLLKRSTRCLELRWSTGNRIFAVSNRKCVGAQGKSEGSEVSLYDCDDNTDLQKWECKNETLLVLKGTQYYIKVNADESIALSRTVGPNNHFQITGMASGACSRTYRELYTIEGNSFGKPCKFPFLYKDRWFADCTTYDSKTKRQWCAVGTRYENEQWGYCPTTSTEHWGKNLVTGSYYQLNTQSVLTWQQAEASCKQQGASLLSVTDPSEQAFVSALLGTANNKLWIGLFLHPEHSWQWSDSKPFRYVRWTSGNPLPNPGHNCAFLDSAGQHKWQSASCVKKMGYICYKDGAQPSPPHMEQGFCASPWIPYNGHCFELKRTPKTWSDAQKECRKEGGDLVSIRNVEDQSFVVSQLGYAASTDELWIGFNDKRTEGLFDWSDHSTVSFTSWEFGKPAVSTDVEDCVLIRGENGNWADRNCDETHGYICMKQSETESTGQEINLDVGCRIGWRKHGSYCYFVGTETKTFDEAKEDCKSSGSYLADVSNGVDNAFLVSLVGLRPEKHFWLGLSNHNNIDEYVWTNSVVVSFTHWNAEMPGHQQGCVAMTTGALAGLWDVLPCTNREKYICKHLADGAVLTPAPPTQSPPKCEEGWTRVGLRNYCAKFFTGPRANEKNWFEARDYCRAIGGELLSIHGVAELHIERYGRAWIGLHIPETGSGFEWSDGTSVNFQHWQEGEPNNKNHEESCTEFQMDNRYSSGSWNDVNCENYNDWVCQIRAGVTPKPPPNNTAIEYNKTADGWIIWNGNHYYFHRYSMSMEDARHYCKQKHGDLVSINSKAENIFLWKQIIRSYGSFYIGLSVDLDGSYWWMDGSPMTIQKWDEDQPNRESFSENCVVLGFYQAFWRTCNCGQDHQFICKRPGSAPVNTTVAPTVPPKGGCPLKWNKFDSKCYSINTRAVSWEEARKQCITIGGNLVSIPSRREQAFLTTKMAEVATTDLWIGLNGLNKNGFFWSDGKKRKYTNWAYSKNRHHPGSFYQRWNEEDCVALTSNHVSGMGKWVIKSCNDTNGFICYRGLDPNIPPPVEPSIPNIYVTLGNDSIKLVNKNLTWDDAQKHCQGDKAKLASLRNEWTHAYVELLSMNIKGPLWIGLNKLQTGGSFRFIDGWHLSFASWAEGEPKRDLPCVYLDVNGKWRTAFCNRTMKSVCIQSSDVAPTESPIFPGVCPEDTAVEYQQSYTWLPFKGHCYLFVTDDIEWAAAASSCVRHGGVLASIEDAPEQKFIENTLEIFRDSHPSFWIGLFKTHTGTWKWLDKTVMDYIKWAEDEPDDDEYGEIVTSDGTWRTGRRWYDRAYICKTAKVMPGDSGSRAEPHGGQDSRKRVHTNLIIVLVITAVSTLAIVGFFVYKRAPLPSLPTFDNPLYFNTERSQPDVVDTNKLIENAEEEKPEPILTL